MNRRPGQVDVVTEVGYCPSCGRTRNLRREEHRLGTLVRTVVTCETCHRTLSSSIGVATVEPIKPEPEPEREPEPMPAPTPSATKKAAAAKKPGITKKPVAAKKAPAKKAAVKKAPGKPTSTSTRKPTRHK